MRTEPCFRVGSGRHSEVMDRITEHLKIGKYLEWDEEKRLEFLNRELTGKRPLVPPGISFSDDELAVVNAFRCVAEAEGVHGTQQGLIRVIICYENVLVGPLPLLQ